MCHSSDFDHLPDTLTSNEHETIMRSRLITALIALNTVFEVWGMYYGTEEISAVEAATESLKDALDTLENRIQTRHNREYLSTLGGARLVEAAPSLYPRRRGVSLTSSLAPGGSRASEGNAEGDNNAQ